jgi:hypothetical protein
VQNLKKNDEAKNTFVMNVKMVIISQMKVEVLHDNVILHLFTVLFDLVTTPNAREYWHFAS